MPTDEAGFSMLFDADHLFGVFSGRGLARLHGHGMLAR
jgi:hypothetical protein